jgi:hypothetical protein
VEEWRHGVKVCDEIGIIILKLLAAICHEQRPSPNMTTEQTRRIPGWILGSVRSNQFCSEMASGVPQPPSTKYSLLDVTKVAECLGQQHETTMGTPGPHYQVRFRAHLASGRVLNGHAGRQVARPWGWASVLRILHLTGTSLALRLPKACPIDPSAGENHPCWRDLQAHGWC